MKPYPAVIAAGITASSVAMIVLCDSSDIASITNPEIRKFLDLRLQQLGNFNDGLLLLVEAGDSVDALGAISNCEILYDPFEDVHFGHPDFTPAFDSMEAHQNDSSHIYCYELHQDTGDDGLGITLIVPAEEGIATDLLAMCKQFATVGLTEP